MTTPGLVLYGIPNCDTVRRARRELDAAGIHYRFHDFRKHGMDAALLDRWLAQASWADLLNRRGTTWRRLPAEIRESIDAESARALMLADPTLIRRPVIELAGTVRVGWDGTTAAVLGARS